MPKAWGGCSLVLHPVLVFRTKEQPPSYAKASEAKARWLRSPPSHLRQGYGGQSLRRRVALAQKPVIQLFVLWYYIMNIEFLGLNKGILSESF